MAVTYLDHNATSPLCKEAQQAMLYAWQAPLNPSSLHQFGRGARKLMEDARDTLLTAVNTENCRLIFTASGTEANNLAMKGLEGIDIFVSAIEHPSILKSANYAGIIPVDEHGVVRLDALEKLLKSSEKKPLISVMLANNETGVIQPIKEIAALAKEYGAYVHTDAVQAFGKIPVSMAELGVDILTISAHKIGGPVGAAALIIKKNLPLKAQIHGGGQEQSFRAGTENVAAITAFAAATKAKNMLYANDNIRALRDWMENELETIAGTELVIAKTSPRLPNTSCIMMPGVSNETQLMHFDMAGIAVSAGSACSSGKVEASHVLLAQGIEKEQASQTIRVSIAATTTKEELNKFIESWATLWKRSSTTSDQKYAVR